MTIKDQITFTRPRRAITTAFNAVSAIQHELPGYQVIGVAVLFKTLVDESGLDVSEVLNQAARIASDDDTFFQREMKALRDYVKNEVKK